MPRRNPDLEELQKEIGYIFLDSELLEEAMTHSTSAEGAAVRDNRRLAFLGDAVIELAVRTSVFSTATMAPRGKLSENADKHVEDKLLALRARNRRLGDWLDMGAGEAKNDDGEGRRLADAFEALIGAIYCDAGPTHSFAIARRLLLLD